MEHGLFEDVLPTQNAGFSWICHVSFLQLRSENITPHQAQPSNVPTVSEVALEVQKWILPRWGFDPSIHGAQEAEAAIAAVPWSCLGGGDDDERQRLGEEVEENKKTREMMGNSATNQAPAVWSRVPAPARLKVALWQEGLL